MIRSDYIIPVASPQLLLKGLSRMHKAAWNILRQYDIICLGIFGYVFANDENDFNVRDHLKHFNGVRCAVITLPMLKVIMS